MSFEQVRLNVKSLAQERQLDAASLLDLLRLLEELHREIRETLFQEALPTSRHELYKLLKDIEEKGGWPYIYRMKLRDFASNLLQDEESGECPDSPPLMQENSLAASIAPSR